MYWDLEIEFYAMVEPKGLKAKERSCSYERVIHVSVVLVGHQYSKKNIPNFGPTNGLVLENVLIVFMFNSSLYMIYDGYIRKFPS